MSATPEDDFVLVAMKGGSIRALAVMDGMTCLELAETLREWGEFDIARRPLVMLRSVAMKAMRDERTESGRTALSTANGRETP